MHNQLVKPRPRGMVKRFEWRLWKLFVTFIPWSWFPNKMSGTELRAEYLIKIDQETETRAKHKHKVDKTSMPETIKEHEATTTNKTSYKEEITSHKQWKFSMYGKERNQQCSPTWNRESWTNCKNCSMTWLRKFQLAKCCNMRPKPTRK